MKLFDELDQVTQLDAQHRLETMPAVVERGWVGEKPDIREIIKTGRSNFTDWRYLPEKQSVGGGIPKGLINVAEAMRLMCLEHVLQEIQADQDGK